VETYDVIIIGGGHDIPRLTACDQCARGVWQVRSTHRTSAGVVGYAHCPCGAWQVLLDGRPLATAHSRPRAVAPPVPDERPHRRHRLWPRLWRRRQKRADLR
jgi:hypothetical protein